MTTLKQISMAVGMTVAIICSFVIIVNGLYALDRMHKQVINECTHSEPPNIEPAPEDAEQAANTLYRL